jgi:hypothetical protein
MNPAIKGRRRPGPAGILWVVLTLGVATGVNLVQRQHTIALRAEKELRRTEAAEAEQLRTTNAQLRAAQPDPAALAALQADRTALARLRAELAALENATRTTPE